ncbi:MAG: hypothetical protein Q7R88_00265, partial [bacterium]|nr:hypothetical protein [bacterium]
SEFRMLSSSVLTVFVTERLAVARLCNTACFLMDETGLLFAEAEGTSTAQLLRIRVPGGDIAPGFQFLDGERLIALLGFAGTLRTIGFGVSELSVNGEELVVRLQSGARILLHLEKQYGTIERHLQALVAEKDLFAKGAGSIETLEYIDLRYGNKIYFKPK